MPEPFQLAALDEPEAVGVLGKALGDWEPNLEILVPPPDSLLYEPDGTLYAVALADGMSVVRDHRARPLLRGDLIVVPEGLALDLEPAVDLLAVRYEGTRPEHFRERFLQVWGFEYLPAPPSSDDPANPERLTEIISRTDPRHRVPYAVLKLSEETPFEEQTGLDMALLVALDGIAHVEVSESESSFHLLPRSLAAIAPGQTYRILGKGQVGRLILISEPLQELRRLAGLSSSQPTSPEYPPVIPQAIDASTQLRRGVPERDGGTGPT